jgi:hypothetical protein
MGKQMNCPNRDSEKIRITIICPLDCAREAGLIIEKSFLAGFEYLPEETGEKIGAHFINDWVITKTEKGYSFRCGEKEQSK